MDVGRNRLEHTLSKFSTECEPWKIQPCGHRYVGFLAQTSFESDCWPQCNGTAKSGYAIPIRSADCQVRELSQIPTGDSIIEEVFLCLPVFCHIYVDWYSAVVSLVLAGK